MKKILLFTVLGIFWGIPVFSAIDELIVEYETPVNRNYGTEVTLHFFVKNKKGKKKELNKTDMDNFTVNKSNCHFDFYISQKGNDLLGKLILAPTPSNPDDSIATIDFTYTFKKESTSQSLKFTLNFKGEIKLDFSGKQGKSAKTFDGLGQVILSNKSHDGDNGENGGDGKDIEVTIAKRYSGGDSSYLMTIHDLAADIYYQYHLKSTISQLSIASNGGNGGDGSDGTRGSETNRFRVDGGNAGNGGNGGNAGKILFYLDDRATELQYKISLSNHPGLGGDAGRPGDGVTHHEHRQYVGVRGKEGTKGTDGLAGQPAQIELRKFQ